MNVDDAALAEGRVFVDRTRALHATALVPPGATVDAYPASATTTPEVVILDRKDDLIAVAKPAGLSTIPDQRGMRASLQGELARLLGERDPKRLHPTSRLDHEVSGVVLFALGPRARDQAHAARANGDYLRHYVAITGSPPEPREGRADEPIGRGSNPLERRVHGRDAKPSATRYATIAEVPRAALLAAEPVTGRTHQIRVHLAHRRAPLLGDRRYGSTATVVASSGAVLPLSRVALHAFWVRLVLNANQPAWTIRCPVPAELLALWAGLGGDPADWQAAEAPLPQRPV